MDKIFEVFKVKKKETLLTIIVLLVLSLSIIGIINQFSLSMPESLKDSGSYYKIARMHFLYISVGIFLVWIMDYIPFKAYENTYIFISIYIIGLILLLMLFPFGLRINGALRWLSFAGIRVQPSEIAKLSFIIFASGLSNFKNRFKKNYYEYILITSALIYIGIILITRSLSSSLQIAGLLLAILWFDERVDIRYPLFIMFMGIIGVLLTTRNGYRAARFGQTEQAKLAIESIKRGGLFGKGFGGGLSRNFYLPEVQTDYVFAGFVEEWGFVGAIVIIILFLLLIFYLYYSAKFTKLLFKKLLIYGVASMLTIQFLLHILINVNIAPSTGVTLPFFSYGGSSTVVNFIGIGLALKAILLMKNNFEEKE